MSNNPAVSIIMPVYNAEKYLREAIDSVITQTFTDWELIIINDGSTDNTENIINEYNDDKIVLFSQQNSGVSVARNKGLENIRGKYITFLDSDDIFPKNSLKYRFEYLESNPNIDLVDGIVEVKDESLKKVFRTYTPYYKGELLPQLLKLNEKVFLGICYFFRSELIKESKFKETMTHSEDLLFYIELSYLNQIKYGHIKEKIYYYRVNNSSAMVNLKGLENGYIKLLQEIKKLNCTTFNQLGYIKIKIIKIMFLSWLSQKRYINALISLGNILFSKGSN